MGLVRKRTLGKTELEVSELTLGTWGLAAASYGAVPEGRFAHLVRHAFELGITTFDMAPLWGDGESERVVGATLKSRRDRVQLVTRVGAERNMRQVQRSLGPTSLVKSCEASLERLGTDVIDVLLVHNPGAGVLDREETRKAMDGLVLAGKIRTWGVTTPSIQRAREALAHGAQVVSVPYNVLSSDLLHDLSDEIVTSACGVLTTSPLCYGLLSGTWAEDRVFPAGDHRRNRWNAPALRLRVKQARMMEFLVDESAPTLATAALRFVLSSALVSSCAIGPRSLAQLEELVTCAKGPPYLAESLLTRLPQVLAAAGV